MLSRPAIALICHWPGGTAVKANAPFASEVTLVAVEVKRVGLVDG